MLDTVMVTEKLCGGVCAQVKPLDDFYCKTLLSKTGRGCDVAC